MLKSFEKLLTEAFTWLAMLVQILMVIVVTYTVFTRYFLNFTPSWGEESALLCMVWFGFLSIALGVHDDLHLSLDIIDRIMPKKLVCPLEMFKYLVVMAIGAFMVYQGLIMVEIGSLNSLPGLQISSAWIYLVVPLSGAATIIYCVSALIGLAKKLSGGHYDC